MPYYEYEQLITEIKEIERKEKEKEEEDKKRNSFNMPSIPNYQMPKISIPKF